MALSLKHRLGFHDYVPVCVNTFVHERRNYELAGVICTLEHPIIKARTRVLYRCACGAVKTIDLAGHWTLADVKAA